MKKFFHKVGKYFADVKLELKKVVWPPFNDVTVSVKVVVASIVIATVFVLGVDTGFQQLVMQLF